MFLWKYFEKCFKKSSDLDESDNEWKMLYISKRIYNRK